MEFQDITNITLLFWNLNVRIYYYYSGLLANFDQKALRFKTIPLSWTLCKMLALTSMLSGLMLISPPLQSAVLLITWAVIFIVDKLNQTTSKNTTTTNFTTITTNHQSELFCVSHHPRLLPLELVGEANCDDLHSFTFVYAKMIHPHSQVNYCLASKYLFLHLKAISSDMMTEILLLIIISVVGFSKFSITISTHRFVIVDFADFWHRQLEVHSEGLAFTWGGNVNNPISILET